MSPATVAFLMGFLFDLPAGAPQASVPQAATRHYPLGTMTIPDLGAGEPFKSDLRYHVSDTDRTTPRRGVRRSARLLGLPEGDAVIRDLQRPRAGVRYHSRFRSYRAPRFIARQWRWRRRQGDGLLRLAPEQALANEVGGGRHT
jgi:hypothetical protein